MSGTESPPSPTVAVDLQEVSEALPSYEIGAEIGRGGWGVVLSGRHRHLDREVAIKQLPPFFAADPTVRLRFVAEARVLASLDHPHVVRVYDYVEQDGLCLLVMEMLPGGTVWSRFGESGFTPPAACAVALAASAGLHAAHSRNILHRDVKPENIMFSGSGSLKVTDFGIAKVVGGEETLATRAGEVLGTPAYIAPEQARGGDLSPATDVYALSTVLYELLSGALPFDDDVDALVLMFKHAFEEPTPLSEKAPSIPDGISSVVMRGLATDPAARYSSAEEFALELAGACTSVWGPGWLTAAQVPVMGAPSIVAVTERTTDRPSEPVSGVRAEPGSGVRADPGSGLRADPGSGLRAEPGSETTSEQGTGSTAGRPTLRGQGPSAAPATVGATALRPPGTLVRPSVALRPRGPLLGDMSEADLVPLKDVVKAPPSAKVPILAAAGAVLVALIVAFIGVGSPTLGGDLPHGAVSVGGRDPTSGAVVRLDTSNDVAVDLGAGAPSADRVRLSLYVLGIDVSDASAPVVPSGPNATATVDDSGARYLVAGRLTAKLELLRSAAVVGTWSFAARTVQPSVLSLAAAIDVVLLLFAVAYGESFLRSLRRGRRRVSSSVGLGVMGLMAGVAVVGLAWLAAGTQPEIATLVVCAVLCAGAGSALAVAGARIGRARRSLREQRNAQRKRPATARSLA